jgi:LAS seventeen-binding protein 5
VNPVVQAGLAAANAEGEVTKLQERQRAAVSRAIKAGSYRGKDRHDSEAYTHLHPDLQDLSFGALGGEQRGLPAPLHPSLPEDGGIDSWKRRGSLSDFSNFEDDSSDEGRMEGKGRGHVTVSDDDEGRNPIHHASGSGHNKLVDVDDPFADPFAG